MTALLLLSAGWQTSLGEDLLTITSFHFRVRIFSLLTATSRTCNHYIVSHLGKGRPGHTTSMRSVLLLCQKVSFHYTLKYLTV